uniref:LRRCT domain-containing protein n=1 Tax=Elaeophora elaphi TaxID=1147741 RepID=A0A0R3RP55_9BILA
LEVLDLSDSNLLEYIDEDAFEVSDALRIFNVHSCALKTFPPTLFDWKKVAELYLHGNPLHCDHKLLTFLPDVLRLRSIHNVICATPTELHNVSISSLDIAETATEEAKQTLTVLCFTLTALTAIIMLVLFLYSRITTPIQDKIRESKSNQQFCRNVSGRSECIFPEYYNSMIEFNSSSASRKENAIAGLLQSRSFYDRISTQIPVNVIYTNNKVCMKQTDFIYLSNK